MLHCNTYSHQRWIWGNWQWASCSKSTVLGLPPSSCFFDAPNILTLRPGSGLQAGQCPHPFTTRPHCCSTRTMWFWQRPGGINSYDPEEKKKSLKGSGFCAKPICGINGALVGQESAMLWPQAHHRAIIDFNPFALVTTRMLLFLLSPEDTTSTTYSTDAEMLWLHLLCTVFNWVYVRKD